MKIASVVLVLQFIGYNSGVIVPSGVAKASNKVLLDNKSTITEKWLKNNFETSKQINDEELYQTTADKKNNLTERSFVIIKRRFKNNYRAQQAHLAPDQIIFSDQLYSKAQSVAQQNKSPLNPTPHVTPLTPLFVPNMKTKYNMLSKYHAATLKYEPPNYYVPSKYQHIPEAHTARGLEASYSKPIYIYPGKSLTRYGYKKQASNLSEETYFANLQNKLKEHYFPNKTTVKPTRSGKKLQTAAFTRHRLNYQYRSQHRLPQKPVNREVGTSYKPDISTVYAVGDVSPLDPAVESETLLERFLEKITQDITMNSTHTTQDTSESPKLCKKCKSNTANKNAKNCKCKTSNKEKHARNFIRTSGKAIPTNSPYDYYSEDVNTIID